VRIHHWKYLRKENEVAGKEKNKNSNKQTKKQSDTLHVSTHIGITLRQTLNKAKEECVVYDYDIYVSQTQRLVHNELRT
jgi:hypothetical protein